jgi:hypothetical protein
MTKNIPSYSGFDEPYERSPDNNGIRAADS